MTTQIQEMEKQIQTLISENEALKKAKEVFPTVIPIVSIVVPSRLAENLAPQGKLITAVSISSKDVSAANSSNTQVQAGEGKGASELVKPMEQMTLKKNEIKTLKKANKKLE